MRLFASFAVLLLLAAPAIGGDEEIPVAVGGRVVDEHGKPMAGATVHAGLYEAGNHMKTGADGRFALRLRSKKIPLLVFTNGYLPYEREHPNGTRDLEIRMAVGARVRGRLAVPAGEKMPRTVRVLSRLARGWSHTAEVSADGRFETGGFEDGHVVRLGIWAPHFMPVMLVDHVLAATEPCDVGTVKLGYGRLVSIRVRTPDGPVEGARVRVQSTAWTPFQWDVSTDASGVARVLTAPFNKLRVDVRGPHTDSDTWTTDVEYVEAARAGPVETTVTIDHPVTLQGTLVWAGAGEAPWAGKDGVAVRVIVRDRTRPRFWHGRTAGKGSAAFTVPGCVPGDWKDAEIRVAVGARWAKVRRTLKIPRVDQPRGRVELGEIHVRPPTAK